MFDSEFYPTPPEIIQYMISDNELAGKTVLEPSAGKGDIVEYCQRLGAEVHACEKNDELRKLVSSKCHVIESDFFNVGAEDVSHIDYIIMNPPFSNADKHIKHAWDIAPDGCIIVGLCNAETYQNSYSRSRAVLRQIIEDYGLFENIESVFSGAERRTDVVTGLIRLWKPSANSEDMSDYFDMEEDDP